LKTFGFERDAWTSLFVQQRKQLKVVLVPWYTWNANWCFAKVAQRWQCHPQLTSKSWFIDQAPITRSHFFKGLWLEIFRIEPSRSPLIFYSRSSFSFTATLLPLILTFHVIPHYISKVADPDRHNLHSWLMMLYLHTYMEFSSQLFMWLSSSYHFPSFLLLVAITTWKAQCIIPKYCYTTLHNLCQLILISSFVCLCVRNFTFPLDCQVWDRTGVLAVSVPVIAPLAHWLALGSHSPPHYTFFRSLSYRLKCLFFPF